MSLTMQRLAIGWVCEALGAAGCADELELIRGWLLESKACVALRS
jgi:hypothetical protein